MTCTLARQAKKLEADIASYISDGGQASEVRAMIRKALEEQIDEDDKNKQGINNDKDKDSALSKSTLRDCHSTKRRRTSNKAVLVDDSVEESNILDPEDPSNMFFDMIRDTPKAQRSQRYQISRSSPAEKNAPKSAYQKLQATTKDSPDFSKFVTSPAKPPPTHTPQRKLRAKTLNPTYSTPLRASTPSSSGLSE